jgi:transcriptional regulator with XRE-family HTH domain
MWIRQRREELGISQTDLAIRLQLLGLEITPGSISHWERGRYKPPLHDKDFRILIADALRLSVVDMLALADYETDIDTSSSIYANRAMEILGRLPERLQHLAVEYLELLEEHQKELSEVSDDKKPVSSVVRLN